MLDDAYLRWATERERIRFRKETGKAWPWTTDPILRDNSFCNVCRRDDRTTVFIKAAILDPFVTHPQFVQIVAAARLLNLPATLLALNNLGVFKEPNIDFDLMVAALRKRAADGEKNFSPAYMVRSETGMDKPQYVRHVVEPIECHALDYTSRQRFTESLSEYRGFSSFLAGQVAADLSYTRVGHLWADNDSWAPLGPGAVRGMNRCLGREPEAKLTVEEYLGYGREAFEKVKLLVNPNVDFHDVASNVMCETDKYLRYQERGKGGRKYHHEL